MRHVRRAPRATVLSLGLTTLLVFAPSDVGRSAGLDSSGDCTGEWNLVKSPDLGDVLDGVSAVSATDVWAVGDYVPVGGVLRTLVQHWDGTRWRVVPSPNPDPDGSNHLEDVWAISAADVWAVGWSYPDVLIEHWDGANWTVVPSPPIAAESFLYAVSAVSPNDVWAVGHVDNRNKTLIEHWDGKDWSIVPSPNPGGPHYVEDVWAASSTDAWAVGYFLRGPDFEPLILHWDGIEWSMVPPPSTGLLYGVSGTSATDVWAVGEQLADDGGSTPTLTLHWDGVSWSAVPSAKVTRDSRLHGIVAISAMDAWAVGNYRQKGQYHTLTEHWDGTAWSIVPSESRASDNYLFGVDAVSPNDLWAVGYVTPDPVRPLIEHYCTAGR